MLRKFSIALVAATATAMAVVPSVSTAVAAPAQESPDSTQIQAFVDRVDARFGVSIDGSDYELRRGGDEVWILRKDAKTPQVATVRHKGKAEGEPDSIEKVVTAESTRPPTPVEAARMTAAGDVTVMQDTTWYQPICQARLTDPEDAGNMDTCFKWGDMKYAGATRQNWAFHMYASCWPGGANFFEVTECYVDTVKHSSSSTLYWNDWSPKATIDLTGCGSYSLGIAAGPVNASWSHNTCGEVVPEKGSDPADMRTRTVDDLYYTSDVNEVAQIIGIGTASTQTMYLAPAWGYFYQSCTPGNPLYWCG